MRRKSTVYIKYHMWCVRQGLLGIAFYRKLYGNTWVLLAKSSNITCNVTEHRLRCLLAWWNRGNGQNLAVSIGSFLSRLWAHTDKGKRFNVHVNALDLILSIWISFLLPYWNKASWESLCSVQLQPATILNQPCLFSHIGETSNLLKLKF